MQIASHSQRDEAEPLAPDGATAMTILGILVTVVFALCAVLTVGNELLDCMERYE